MQTQKTLAVKYRPKTFEDVVEQNVIKAALQDQIDTGTIKNCYLFCGASGTGKTTDARIFAQKLNGGNENIVELDAASNSGVENFKSLLETSRLKPIGTPFRIFIVDECVTGDTEILTEDGWKRIDSICEDEVVAQYTDDGHIEFVKIDEYVSMEYSGDMYEVSFRNGKNKVLMTPHHVQPVRMKISKKVTEKYIKDCIFAQSNEILVSGNGTGNNEMLTSLERLFIACQADGYSHKNNNWEIHICKKEKIDRVIYLLRDCNIEYRLYGDVNSGKPVSIRFQYNFPSDKKLKSYFNLNMGIDRAKDFIEEILKWDDSKLSGYPGYYSCVDEDNVDFVSAVLAQCCCSASKKVHRSTNPNHSDLYTVHWFYTDSRPSTSVSKKVVSGFDGRVYCVKVPSKKIVLRADGFTFVSGNCHALSNASWQSALLSMEEPVPTSIFIYCTTDPQKIPATITGGRVQRFDFQRISHGGIVNRLKYIIDCENKEGHDYTYEEDGIDYIAKLANGGMRNAIAKMEHVLSYSHNITVENVSIALGTVDYVCMFDLTDGLCKMDKKAVIEIIETVHRDGKDLKQFIKDYCTFVLDLCKYDIMKSFEYLQIPSTYSKRVSNYKKDDFAFFTSLLNEVLNLNSNIKWEPMPKPLVESTFILLCSEA